MKNNLKIILIAFIAGIVGAYAFNLSQSYFSPKATNLKVEEKGQVIQVKKTPQSKLSLAGDFSEAAALSTPSVVYIRTVSEASRGGYSIFDLYFGEDMRNRRQMGSGSGVIFTSDGYIVTNNHVIENAEVIEVIHQKRTYKGEIVGTDPNADLAIIKIDGKNLPNIKLGSSKSLQVGEWVIAVGNPYNLTSTVTAGIVSAKGRDIELLSGRFPLESFIQTDAAINPGNSGGALVNIKGELVGINTAILSRTGSYTGYGFAVPVDIVAKIFNDLIQYGEVQKAFAGVEVSNLNSEAAQKYGIKEDQLNGAVVVEVQPNSPASKLGIQEGDVILKLNNETIDSKSNFEEQLSYYRPGDKLRLTYRSSNQNKESQITLTNREGTTSVIKREVYDSEKLGASFEALSKVEKDKIGTEYGVRVVEVKRGLFSRLGINKGFIITAINRREIQKPEEVEEILSKIDGRVYIEGIDANGVRGYYQFFF